jgi:hypothetical protein
MNESTCSRCLALQAEVARLREELEAARVSLLAWRDRWDDAESARQDARSECEIAQTRLNKAVAEVARLTQEQSSGWQPIETAPKDGTWFLAHEPGESMKAMRWDTDTRDKNHAWRDHELLKYEPTHWMPLPDPPAALASLQQEGTKK